MLTFVPVKKGKFWTKGLAVSFPIVITGNERFIKDLSARINPSKPLLVSLRVIYGARPVLSALLPSMTLPILISNKSPILNGFH